MSPRNINSGEGLYFETISEAIFRQFALQQRTSDETGPIGPYLDGDHGNQAYGEPFLFGLLGCGELRAAV